jgi:hypothetical protein
MPPKKKTPAKARAKTNGARPNGRMLTVKQLDRKSYDAVHSLPRGQRGPALKTLLSALAKFRAGAGETADKALADGRVALIAVEG